MEEYGPFAEIVAIGFAIVAMISAFLVRMIGKINQWTWLSSGSPSFMVTAGSRMVAVALIAVTYVTINDTNYIWFGIAALVFGGFGFWSVARFDRLRKLYVVSIPLVGQDGRQLVDDKGKLRSENVVIGLESQMLTDAKDAYDKARKKARGLSVTQFMSGYGSTKINDPEAIWSKETLADISNKLFITLMYIALSAIMALFLAAMVVVYN